LVSAFYGLSYIDSVYALQVVEKWKNYQNYSVSQAICSLLSKNAFKNENAYFEKTINHAGYGKRNIMYIYAKYLMRSDNATVADALNTFERLGKKMDGEERKYLLFNSVNEIKENLIAKNELIKKQLAKDATNTALQAQNQSLENLIKKYEELVKTN
jgi:hypothetical protein